MKSLEESVVIAMDGSEPELFPFLPYILQDLWEIGASPEVIIELVRKHTNNFSSLRILDLGCGKGAVSIQLAKALGCACLGFDAIKEFINEANDKAIEFGVEHLCHFEIGDIRKEVTTMTQQFDIIILGAIGPVFGDYGVTLSVLSRVLKHDGLIIIDDGYMNEDSSFAHPLMQKKKLILQQISDARMEFIDEVVFQPEAIKNSDDYMIDKVTKRCTELIEKHPDQRCLFENYMKKQEEENEVLETKVVCSTMVIRKK